MRTARSVTLVCVILVAAAVLIAGRSSAADFEQPPTLRAADVLPALWVKGPNHEVEAAVRNDGVRNQYRVETPQGVLEVDGTERLGIRIREIDALQLMEETKSSTVFTDALKAAAKSPYYAAKGLITSPVRTLSDVATGVGNFLGNVGHTIFGKPSEDESGTLAAAAGFDAAKRQFAFRFGVDPYSRYEAMQERLNDLAWAAFGGGLPMTVAFSAIPGNVGTTVQVSGLANRMSKLVSDKSPRELKDINNTKLEKMGFTKSIRRAFLDHPQYSPTKTTMIVGALEGMAGVAERELLLERAVLAQDEPSAFLYQVQAELLAGYHRNIAPAKRLLLLGSNVFLQRKDGVVVGLFPADYVIWRETSAATLAAMNAGLREISGAHDAELWLTGAASPLCRDNVTKSGWKLVENARERLRLP